MSECVVIIAGAPCLGLSFMKSIASFSIVVGGQVTRVVPTYRGGHSRSKRMDLPLAMRKH